MKTKKRQARIGGKRYISSSPEETRKIWVEVAQSLVIPAVVLLYGDLGSGKTTLTRGIAEGLGLEDLSLVSSPSYTLVNVYQARCSIYHVDLYRLEGERDLYSTGIDDFVGREGVTVIEWSERLAGGFAGATVIRIVDAGGDRRELNIIPPGETR